MNNEKCDCKNFERGNHRTPLIKLDLPEYEDYRYSGTSHTILRSMRLIGYVIVLVLLSYSLWRIRIIESKIQASDKLSNITRILQSSNAFQKRTTRSIQEQMLMNSFGSEKSTIAKDQIETSWKKPTNKGEFDELVNDLFDKIKAMHDDSDRGHFDRNMKAVFKAWFPVFDALLPREFREDNETRKTREASTKQEYFYKPRISRSLESNSDESDNRYKRKDDVSSEESDKEDNKNDKSDEDGSDESNKKNTRPTRSTEISSDESDKTYIKPVRK